MEVSEKKLGCLKGTVRTNVEYVGYIEGSVNENLKSGYKQVSIIDGKVVFWIVNDYDVAVTAEDITSYSVASVNTFTRTTGVSKKRSDGQTTRVNVHEYTVNYALEFVNGKSGILKVRAISVYDKDNLYNSSSALLQGYIPEVKGWLAPNNTKDEHYDDIFCPEGYKADIRGYRKVCEISPRYKVIKALNLPEDVVDPKIDVNGTVTSYIRVKE